MKFDFGTKAETLKRLSKHAGAFRIPPFLFFSLAEWRQDPKALLDKVVSKLSGEGRCLAVRSSAKNEDGEEASHAGSFHSLLGVPSLDQTALSAAVEAVFESFPDGDTDNQVIVQIQADEAVVSGVILTRDVNDGSPYYILNYDDFSGRTDSVTGGKGAHKAVLIHRTAAESLIQSDRIRTMLRLAREIEGLCGPVPLDIEFGLDCDNVPILFQARRIATASSWKHDVEFQVNRSMVACDRFVEDLSQPQPGLLGSHTILGNMPDWNPAEIIGATPRPLAASLYREIVTGSIWRESRALMGYRPVGDEELMVLLAGRPYIDVRCSLNSFLPDGIPDDLGAKVVDAALERLSAFPQYHDKLEFEIAPTIYDFTFEEELEDRYGEALNLEERKNFSAALLTLTNRVLDTTGSMAWAEKTISDLAATPPPKADMPVLSRVRYLLNDCKARGTLPFSVLARHGFVAEALLRSAVVRGALNFSRMQAFKRSVRTVAGALAADTAEVCKGTLAQDAFLERYGHLRPGTYDILSPRYSDRADLFEQWEMSAPPDREPFIPTDQECKSLNALIAETGITAIDANGLFDYAARAIAGREYGKFVFTKSLSEAMELLVQWGEPLGLDRDDLSFLTLPSILERLHAPVLDDEATHFRTLAQDGAKAGALTTAVKLSYLIRDTEDVYVVPIHRAAPNFITGGRIEGAVLCLGVEDWSGEGLYGAIVCIENADPGFDWIFAKGIAGLVTKYGGANSHMAIRCAEFGLPAAIGCGELTFNHMKEARIVELNCAEKLLRVIQ